MSTIKIKGPSEKESYRSAIRNNFNTSAETISTISIIPDLQGSGDIPDITGFDKKTEYVKKSKCATLKDWWKGNTFIQQFFISIVTTAIVAILGAGIGLVIEFHVLVEKVNNLEATIDMISESSTDKDYVNSQLEMLRKDMAYQSILSIDELKYKIQELEKEVEELKD